MSDCCNIKKVATVTVYENKNEVKHYGYMAGDRNTPVLEVIFRHFWDIQTLKDCKLRWVLVDDTGSLVVGETSINDDNKASIPLPNELFNGERRMKVQLTVASCDGSRILNLQQITDLKVISSLATNEVVEPVYGMLINGIYDETQRCIESIKKYLLTTPNGGNAEYLRGYAPDDFLKKNYAMSEENAETLKTSTDYKLGDIVSLLGYYSKGDRGAHKRIIESTSKVGGIQLANGLWANVLPLNDVVWVEWFGLNESSKNCSVFFNLASEFTYYHANKMMCQKGIYFCLDTIKMSTYKDHDLNMSELNFNDSTAKVGVLATGWFEGTEGTWRNSGYKFSIRNFTVRGLTKFMDGYFTDTTDFHKPNYLYKQSFIGIEAEGACWMDQVMASACEEGIVFRTRDTWSMTLDKCVGSRCKYGLVLDLRVDNSNENIKIYQSGFSNNWCAFKTYGTGASFYNCSIDYNWLLTDPEIPWTTGFGGTPNGLLSFDQCWIEDNKSNVPVVFTVSQSQVVFDKCYIISGTKTGAFIKGEDLDTLITFNNTLFGSSGPIATDKTRLLMRGTTYHKFWSTAGASKFRKVDNLLYNGYMEVPLREEAITPDGNLVRGWNLKQSDNGPGMTYNTMKYVANETGGNKLLVSNGKFRACQVWSSKVQIRTGDFLTIKAKSDSSYCEAWFYDSDGELIVKQYLSTLNGIRYHKLQPVPTGATAVDVIFANPYYDSSGTDEMIVEYCEVNVVN